MWEAKQIFSWVARRHDPGEPLHKPQDQDQPGHQQVSLQPGRRGRIHRADTVSQSQCCKGHF